MFTLNPSRRAPSQPAQAPVAQQAPAPAISAVGLLRVRSDITFKLGDRPKGTPGKKEFNMRAVFELDATTYLTVLDGVRQLCILGGLDMTKSIKFQAGPQLHMVFNMVLETFPGFGEFDDPKWPIEAFIYVVLKGATEKAKKLEKPQAVPAPALTEDEQAARRDARREAQRNAALTRYEARRAAALRADTEDGPETIDIDSANEVNNVAGDISELQIGQGGAGTGAPVEPPAGAAHTRRTTRAPASIHAEAVMAPANPPTRPPVRVCPPPLPRRAVTPLDPAPVSEPTGPTQAATPLAPAPLAEPPGPPRASPPLAPAPLAEPTGPTRAPPSTPAESTPPASESTPPASTQPATRTPAGATSNHAAGQPFGGQVALVTGSSAVLSRVGSVFLNLGAPDDDDEELSEDPLTEPESQPATTTGKGKGKATTSKGAKGGKASQGGGVAGKKGGKQGTKKAAGTNSSAPAATTRARRAPKKA
ncbi:hypothetical protein FS749_007896 [Ceratobasidium sp. UAMH 11750]|nr:hypothetical protein FS749_007896 [Ceratobasidium sp. UAMH 11750]